MKQWLLRAVWVFNSKNFALNHVFIGKRPRMGCLIGPKIMGPNCGIFGDFWAVRDSQETGRAVCVGS